jgi:large subunit ribosomal protein L10
MSKKVKNLIEKELVTRFSPLDGVAVISPQGIDGTKTNQLRRRLGAKGLKMAVVKNTLARRASEGTKLKGFDKLLDGPSAVIYGKASISSIARMLVEERKNNEKLQLRGVFFDGEIYPGEKGVEQVSKLPTREEAIANPAENSPPPSKAPAQKSAESSRPSKTKQRKKNRLRPQQQRPRRPPPQRPRLDKNKSAKAQGACSVGFV